MDRVIEQDMWISCDSLSPSPNIWALDALGALSLIRAIVCLNESTQTRSRRRCFGTSLRKFTGRIFSLGAPASLRAT